jgi:hypothetical protein
MSFISVSTLSRFSLRMDRSKLFRMGLIVVLVAGSAVLSAQDKSDLFKKAADLFTERSTDVGKTVTMVFGGLITAVGIGWVAIKMSKKEDWTYQALTALGGAVLAAVAGMVF